MASRRNRQLQYYFSVNDCDPDALGFSAFSRLWGVGGEVTYCFAPFHLIPRVLEHIVQSRARAVVVVPFWASQLWWPGLCEIWVDSAALDGKSCFQRPVGDGWQTVHRLPFQPLAVAVHGGMLHEGSV